MPRGRGRKPTLRSAAALAVLAAACGGETAPSPTPDAETAGAPAPRVLFADVTDAAGLDFRHRHGGTGRKYLPEIMGSGGAALDYDGDGWTDLYLVQSGRLPGAESAAGEVGNRLYRNLGDGRFADVTETAGAGDTGYGMGAVAGDVDGDGDPDLYVANFGADRLLRNLGDGRFREATRESGIDNPHWGSSAALFDADLDGWLDLYVANYLEMTVATHLDCGYPTQGILSYCHPDVYPMAPDLFFRNRGGGVFEEATAAAGLTDLTGKGLGVVAADFTGDGLPDLYVANDSTPNFLYRNLGGGRFREDALLLGVGFNEDGQTEAGMGVAAGDADGDGRLDIFVTNLSAETNALYLGGEVMFRYATRFAGLYEDSYLPVGFGTDLADLDNDGDLDLVVVNGHVIDNIELTSDGQSFRQPGQVFWNRGGARFAPAEPEEIADLAVPRVGRGTITLDYDHDGRLDLAVAYNDDRARLYRNTLPDGGGWVRFHATGSRSNREGVGVRISLLEGGAVQVEERTAGSSYESSQEPWLHFGLGAREGVERVRVEWPGGGRMELRGLPARRSYRLFERPADR
ncbi:MAG: CRTAC1 family protein [Thermoanaerobaculia bacterium]|nr:CRTAC1 family protein [Thermoanaerobaculia bacterium]